MITFKEYSEVEQAILEVAYLTVEGMDNTLNEVNLNSVLGKAGFKVTKSKGLISILAGASKGLAQMFVAAMQGDREKVKELAKSVKREDVMTLLLKMDKLSLGLVSAPIGLISEITGWNLEIGSADDKKDILSSVNAILDKLKSSIGKLTDRKVKQYTSIFNKLKTDVA